MGRLFYGEDRAGVDVDDRALAHIQHVIWTKLRRREAFYFTCAAGDHPAVGRRVFWIHPGAHLEFKYHGSKTPPLSHPWLIALLEAANSPAGLWVVPEPPRAGRDAPLVTARAVSR